MTDSSAKVVVVTGSSAGIGRAAAVAFAAAGYDVALLARGRTGLEAAEAQIKDLGRRALSIITDVADYEQVAKAGRRVEEELGPIDVWVNNAMTTTFSPTWELEPEDIRRAVEVTFLGQVWGTLVALQYMRPRDRGNIVNVGSALAFIGIPLQSPYCASKFACRGFFESVRAELLHEGSHVQMGMVHMPAVNTPQFGWCKTTMRHHPKPVPPMYEPELVANHIVKAATDGRRSTVVGSWNKLVAMMGSLLPGIGNQYAALGAWESQLTDHPIDADRPVNLYEAVDDDHDEGARGVFADQAGGVFDPGFLRSLPNTLTTFGRAVARTFAEDARARAESRSRQKRGLVGLSSMGLLALTAWLRMWRGRSIH